MFPEMCQCDIPNNKTIIYIISLTDLFDFYKKNCGTYGFWHAKYEFKNAEYIVLFKISVKMFKFTLSNQLSKRFYIYKVGKHVFSKKIIF